MIRDVRAIRTPRIHDPGEKDMLDKFRQYYRAIVVQIFSMLHEEAFCGRSARFDTVRVLGLGRPLNPPTLAPASVDGDNDAFTQ